MQGLAGVLQEQQQPQQPKPQEGRQREEEGQRTGPPEPQESAGAGARAAAQAAPAVSEPSSPSIEQQQQPQRSEAEASSSGQGEQQGEDGQQQGEEGQQQEGQVHDPARDAERAALAEALKREGNELFGRGQWDAAAAKYNEALDAAPASAPKDRAIYFANLAACNIKTQQYAAAVQNCTEALNLDPTYQKAYMRRCEAFERLDELDHALSDAKKLQEMAPDSAWAGTKVAALQPVVDERTEKLKAEMLSKLKDLGNTILGKFGMSTDNFKFDKDPNTGSYSIRFEK